MGKLLRDKRQRASFAMYALGLLTDGERKSMEPIAARACGAPEQTHAVHERLIHFLGESRWQNEPVRRYAARYAVEAMLTQGSVRTWVVDDTGFLKQGRHSPGVQRQYTGSAGKTANCQVGVSLLLATEHAHVATDFRLYIPESWAQDRERCRRAHIPDDVGYSPKWCLALAMIEEALAAGLPKGVVLADCDYGNKTVFRDMLQVLTDGEVSCWGKGQTVGNCPFPDFECGQAIPPSGKFVAVAAGESHTCALRSDGGVQCWGAGMSKGDCGANECGQSAVPEELR